MGSPFCPNVLRSAFGPLSEIPRWEEVAETSRRGAPSSATEAVPLSQPTFPEASSLWDTSESYSIPILLILGVSTSASRAAPRGRAAGRSGGATAARWGAASRQRGGLGGAGKGDRRGGAKGLLFFLSSVAPAAPAQPSSRRARCKRGSGWAVRGGMYAAGGQIGRAGR